MSISQERLAQIGTLVRRRDAGEITTAELRAELGWPAEPAVADPAIPVVITNRRELAAKAPLAREILAEREGLDVASLASLTDAEAVEYAFNPPPARNLTAEEWAANAAAAGLEN